VAEADLTNELARSTPHDQRNLNGVVEPPPKDVFSSVRAPGKIFRPDLPAVGTAWLPTDLQIVSGSDRDTEEKMIVEGRTRRFQIHLPNGYDGHSALPVVYMMPGYKESLDVMKQETGMNRQADERGFAVVYMEPLKQPTPWTFGAGDGLSWNLDHGTLTPKDPSYDDMNYIKAVDKLVSDKLNVDTDRKYLAGFSEGALAAQYVAQQMRGNFAGIALVHGTLLKDDPRPAPGDPTATIAIVGNNDNMFPLYGGHGWFQGGLLKGFMSINFSKVGQSNPLQQAPAWAKANRCFSAEITDTKHNTITRYSCLDAPVEQIIRKSHFHDWSYQGGMHAWDGPGQDPQAEYGWPLVGEPDRKEDTSRQIVDFLFQYRKPERKH